SLAYGNGLFAAVGIAGGSNRLMTSTDGENWTPKGLKVGDWTALTYGDGLFVGALMGGDERGAISADADNWTRIDIGGPLSITDITYGDGRFVAVGSGVAARGLCAG